ncbi:MAG: hypothetical protein ACRDPF_26320 [Streptosporangiaceae bacterium]
MIMFVAAGRAGIMRSIASPSTRSSSTRTRPRPSTTRWLRSRATSWCARPGVGAMSTTGLDRQLRDRGIDTGTLRGLLSP